MNTFIESLKEFMLTSNLFCSAICDAEKVKEELNNLQTSSLVSASTRNEKAEKQIKVEKITSTKRQPLPRDQLFIPKEKDTLFWCFYIMKHGEIAYETMKFENSNAFFVEKQLKFEYIRLIREKKKELVKSLKWITLSDLENQLGNEHKINVNTFLTLCAVEDLSVFFINNNKTCFEYQSLSPTHVVRRLDRDRDREKDRDRDRGKDRDRDRGKDKMKQMFSCSQKTPQPQQLKSSDNSASAFFGYEGIKDTLEYKEKFLLVDNVDKPFKASTAYKLEELITMATKLGLIEEEEEEEQEVQLQEEVQVQVEKEMDPTNDTVKEKTAPDEKNNNNNLKVMNKRKKRNKMNKKELFDMLTTYFYS